MNIIFSKEYVGKDTQGETRRINQGDFAWLNDDIIGRITVSYDTGRKGIITYTFDRVPEHYYLPMKKDLSSILV